MNRRTAKANSAAKDKPFSAGCNVSQEQWDRIFGKPKTKPKKGRYVLVGDKMVHESELSGIVSTQPIVPSAPSIQTDKLYAGKYDPGAGRVWKSGTERREWMKREQRECIG